MKGLYRRSINKSDICEWKHKTGTTKYPCKHKAEMLVQSPKKGVIHKLCKAHAKLMLHSYDDGTQVVTGQCNNCGCYGRR